MTILRPAAAALVVACLAAPAEAQIFRGGTDLVALHVTVTDQNGQLLSGLSKDVFKVYEDGILQEVTFFSNDRQPIALSILLDTSTSMEGKLHIAQEAAVGFGRQLGAKDVAQVIDFDSRADIIQTFTPDAAELERAIRKTVVGGSTSLYNALYMAISELKKVRATAEDEIRRQAVVVLSDGEDTSSLVDYEQVLEQAKRSEVAVYAIGLRSQRDRPTRGWSEADFALRTLSQETGGREFFVQDAAELPAIYQRIADELATQYTLGYSSKNPIRDGAWRAVVVRVDRPGTTARTKRGYFAAAVRR